MRCEAETGLPKTFFEEQHAAIVDSAGQPDKVVRPKGFRSFILSMAAAAAAIIAVVFALHFKSKSKMAFCLPRMLDPNLAWQFRLPHVLIKLYDGNLAPHLN